MTFHLESASCIFLTSNFKNMVRDILNSHNLCIIFLALLHILIQEELLVVD